MVAHRGGSALRRLRAVGDSGHARLDAWFAGGVVVAIVAQPEFVGTHRPCRGSPYHRERGSSAGSTGW